MTAAPAIPKRHVAAAVAGNALEFYDFLIYAAFALQIGKTFFPVHSAFMSLLLALITFGVGFVLRPVGAVVIGRYADKAGRKPAMLLTLTLMGVAILGLTLTPSYAMIGPAAPILAVSWRMAQGFALGGEVGPTTAFLVEAAPPAKRGVDGAWQIASQGMAVGVGGLVGVILAKVAGPAGLEAWGWRVAMGLGVVILPFGVWLRRTLPETLHHREAPTAVQPARPDLRGHARIIVLGLGLITAATVGTYVMNFMTTYAQNTLHIAEGASLGATLVLGLSGVAGALIGGLLSDRFGRKPMMIGPRIVYLSLVWPGFALIVRNHDGATLLGTVALLSFVGSLGTAAWLVSLTESMRKEVRGVVMGSIYALPVAIVGGTTQPIVASLIHWTGNAMAPAYYLLSFGAVGLIAALLMQETAPARLVAAQ